MAGEPSDAGLITMEQASRLLMIGEERVRQLVKSGHITRPAKGKVLLVSAVQGYIRFLKEDERRSSKSASSSRVADARAREIELRVAREENRVIDLTEHNAVLDEVLAIITTGFESLPARITRDPGQRRKLETEIDDVLNRAADRCAERAAELRESGEAATPPTEDDA